MEKEFEIFEQVEKNFYHKISPLVSKIKELIFQNKQNTKETNDNIQFIIIKSLKYYRIKRPDANIFQKVNNKLKRDFKDFNIDIFVDFNSILTNEDKNLLDEAWLEYMNKIEPIVLKTWKKIFIPYKSSLSIDDYEELNSIATIIMFDALSNYDYKKSKFITYVTFWIKNIIKHMFKETHSNIDDIDSTTSNEIDSEIDIDIETQLYIQKLINNLDERKRLLILKHFYDDKQLNEITRQFEISAPRITKILKDTLKKLENDLTNE